MLSSKLEPLVREQSLLYHASWHCPPLALDLCLSTYQWQLRSIVQNLRKQTSASVSSPTRSSDEEAKQTPELPEKLQGVLDDLVASSKSKPTKSADVHERAPRTKKDEKIAKKLMPEEVACWPW